MAAGRPAHGRSFESRPHRGGIAESGTAQLQPPGCPVVARHQQIAVDPRGVLRPRVRRALRDAHDLGQSHVDRCPCRSGELLGCPGHQADAGHQFVDEHPDAGPGITIGARRHLERGVGQVGVVAAQVEVDPAGPGDGPGCPEAQGLPGGEDRDSGVRRIERGGEFRAVDRRESAGGVSERSNCRPHRTRQSPTGGHIGTDAADLAEHRVHPVASRRLDQVQDLLAPPPRPWPARSRAGSRAAGRGRPRWWAIRVSSHSRIRRCWARSGGVRPSARSTPTTTPISEQNADSQSWRSTSMRIWR